MATITFEKPLKSLFKYSLCATFVWNLWVAPMEPLITEHNVPHNLIASTWEDQLLTIKTRVHRVSKKTVSHLGKYFYSLCDVYEANTTRQCYHEGQWGEEEADDQFDVWLVAYHHVQALTEGDEMGFFRRGLCHPTRRIREESEMRPRSHTIVLHYLLWRWFLPWGDTVSWYILSKAEHFKAG